MANYFAQCSLLATTGETADTNVTSFAFTKTGTLDSGDASYVAGHLTTFWNAVRTSGALLGRAQNAHVIKIYNAVTTTPNYPLDERTFNLTTAPGAITLPLEVQLCISYANDSATIVPRSRRRGRIYIGGQNVANNAVGRPITALQTNLAQNFRDLVEAFDTDPEFELGIWSRANGSIYPIERVYVDNEWDTMRSRGGKSTSRVTLPVLP
jgi:hypothetical protein